MDNNNIDLDFLVHSGLSGIRTDIYEPEQDPDDDYYDVDSYYEIPDDDVPLDGLEDDGLGVYNLYD